MADEKQTLVGGLRAVELWFRPVREISSGNVTFYQSQTRLNTPDLGTLMPENFRDVSEITSQCVSLFKLELVQALETHNKLKEREVSFNWLSVYMPVAFLKEDMAEKKLQEYFLKFEVPTNRICFALSEKLLEESDGVAAGVIGRLRNKGFHFMITGFGGNSCPMMRLSMFPVDYVMLSPEVANYIGNDERSDNAVKSIVGFVSDMGAEAIADGVINSRQAETLFGFECHYCTGNLVGKYVQDRYIRRRSDEE